MDKLPQWIKISIGWLLDLDDLLQYSQINSNFYKLMNTDAFWIGKLSRDWPYIDAHGQPSKSRKDVYYQLVNDKKLGYPDELIAVFSQNQMSISDLPVLDLNGRCGHTDYIDFILPDEMTCGIMRYKDKFDRPGLVFRLMGISNSEIYDYYGLPIKQIKTTIALFQRYTDSTTCWAIGYGNSDRSVEDAYNGHHKRQNPNHGFICCDDCPFNGKNLLLNRISKKIIQNLLSNQDELFSLY